jgi:hypothetical protein
LLAKPDAAAEEPRARRRQSGKRHRIDRASGDSRGGARFGDIAREPVRTATVTVDYFHRWRDRTLSPVETTVRAEVLAVIGEAVIGVLGRSVDEHCGARRCQARAKGQEPT